VDEEEKAGPAGVPSLVVPKGAWLRVWKMDSAEWWTAESIGVSESEGGSTSSAGAYVPGASAANIGVIRASRVCVWPYLGALHRAFNQEMQAMEEMKLRVDIPAKHENVTPVGGRDQRIKEEQNLVASLFRTLGQFVLEDFIDLPTGRSKLQDRATELKVNELRRAADTHTQAVLRYNNVDAQWSAKLWALTDRQAQAMKALDGTLLAACERCDYAAVRALILAAGRFPGAKTKFVNHLDAESGTGALHVTCLQGSWGVSIAELLLQTNADPLLPDARHGDTPVVYAVKSRETACLQLLLDFVDTRARAKNKTPDEIALVRCALVNVAGWRGRTPLHVAASMGHVGLCSWLLDQGASPSAEDADTQSTALHVAAEHGHTDVTALLLSRGASPHARNKEGLPPVYVAAVHARGALLDLYLARGLWLTHSERKNLVAFAHENARQDILFVLRNALDAQMALLE
jgi:ankyrin repeat protein